jgi:GPN-loop GTPase
MSHQQSRDHAHHHYRYGQVVIGPCGSGKTTYCDGMQQYLQLLGRNVVVINFDPANHYSDGSNNDTDGNSPNTRNDVDHKNRVNIALPYTAIYDVCTEAVNLKSVMQQLNLGPNGGLLYCMEYIELHANEIIETIKSRCCLNGTDNNSNPYFIFDFPGQIELYTHSTCVQNLLQTFINKLQMKLTVVQLIDALYCTDVTKFISAALLGTTTMIRLELPTVNLLSKIDLLSSYGSLPFQLDYFTECYDLERLIPFLYQSNIGNDNNDVSDTIDTDEFDIAEDNDYQKVVQKRRTSKFYVRHEKLHRSLAELVDDYSLLSFIPLDITNVESVGRVLAKIDKSNGYIGTTNQSNTKTTINQDLFHCAVQSEAMNGQTMYESLSDIRERIASPESIRELR